LLPISYERQILPGSFEYTLSYLIDNKIDLSVFEDRYQNDATGAPACDPALLLKIVLFAYSKGITTSRRIAALCREHVVFMERGSQTVLFRGTDGNCKSCALRSQCLRYPQRTVARQVAFILGRTPNKPDNYMTKMKRKIDTDRGRHQYSRRLGTVEPVFGNIRHTHRLNRFSLRGRQKVNAQWLLFCLVHNIGKVQRYGSHVMGKKTR
jgi:hypothetical protein